MLRLLAACLFWTFAALVRGEEPARTHDVVVADYFTLASVAQVAVSPDGRSVVYAKERWNPPSDDRLVELWIDALEGGSPRRLTSEHSHFRDVKWGADGRSLYFLGDRKKPGAKEPPFDGGTQVWSMSLEGGEPQAVTRAAEGVAAYDLAADGAIFYTTERSVPLADAFAALRAKHPAEYGHAPRKVSMLHRHDLKSGAATEVDDEPRYIREFAVSRDGAKAALVTAEDDRAVTLAGRSRIEILDLATGKSTPLPDATWRAEAPSPFGRLESLAWSPDGGRLAFHVGFTGFPAEIVVVRWKDGAPQATRLPRAEPLSVRESDAPLQWRNDDELLYLAERRGWGELRSARFREGNVAADVALVSGERVVGGFSFAGEAGVAVFGDADSFPEVYASTRFASGRPTTDLNPQTAAWKLPQVEHVVWKGARGDEVGGVLELPPDFKKGKPLPLIVSLHGGPTTATTADLQFDPYDARCLFAARGYAVFCPNYRGSTGYGDAFQTALVGNENGIEVEDILLGVDELVRRGVADPERLAVLGWSNGGYLTNCLIARTTRFKAASSGAGILDNALQWGTNDLPSHTTALKKGTPWERRDAYTAASPSYRLGAVRTPTLIHAGGDDPRCPPGHGRMLFRALKDFGAGDVPTELVVYPGEPHVLAKYSHTRAKMEWDLAWFHRYVLGKKP